MLFKSKQLTPTNFFPEDFVDIHSHLLPGIDDGVKTLDESVNMIRKIRSYGIRKLITTPHILGNVWPNNPEIIRNKLDEVKEGIKKEGIDLELSAAAEYMLDEKFTTHLKQGLLTLKDDYVLVEFSYLNPPFNLYDVLYAIQQEGYQPVLAHPERYSFYHRSFSDYEKLKHHGCLFQLNLLSMTNHYGKDVQKASKKLLKEGLIDFVGSDSHHMGHLGLWKKVMTKKNERLLREVMERNRVFG